jgi:asparagine synthase (glutamine-hydrolysing)
MCGIIGVTRPIHKEKIIESLQTMQHRGQDGIGVFVDEKISLGHLRLSIIDLQPVSYPIPNEDHSIYVTVNGEFYDHQKIRRMLESKGHQFRTYTDAEIVVHLYEEFGVECMPYLNGEFAFVLYDKKNQRLIAARDRFGNKPLYFSIFQDDYYIASEIKALIKMGVKPTLNKESLLTSSSMQYTLPDQTLFTGIETILPGHLKVIDLNTKKSEDIRYWDIDFTEGPVNENDLKEILIETVRTRMTSDVPICCALSGGLDSSLVFGIANQFKKVNGVTVAFENSEFDESQIARRTAAHFGVDLHTVDLTSKSVTEHLSDAVYYSEGTTINSHLVAKYLLSRCIRDNGYKVVLTGEGSDELFCGYPHFKKDLNIQYNQFEQENRLSLGVMNTNDLTHDYVALYREKLGFIPDFLRVKSAFGLKVFGLYDASFVRDFDSFAIPKNVLAYVDLQKMSTFNSANTSAYLWSKLVLSNYILRTLGDGTEMAHTVEGRTPFLDHRLWDCAGKIAMGKKVEGTIEKKILRDIGKSFITEEVYLKTKQPFIAPPLLVKEKAYLYDHINMLPSFINRKHVLGFLDQMYKADNQTTYAANEPVLFYMYSLMHLLNRFNVRVDG